VNSADQATPAQQSWKGRSMNTVEAEIRHLPPRAARMAAMEILLRDPEALADDVRESCLYIYREKLRAS
jgi:hypothetical protein